MGKIVVVGLGSMGKRRIRLLKDHLQKEVVGVDTNEERIRQTQELFHIPCYPSIDEAFAANEITAAVVSTSPLTHASIVKTLLEKRVHVFVEINLTDTGYEELLQLSQKNGRVLFLSSTMIYRYEVQRLYERAKGGHNLNYTYHIGQYLPDWHPWESYKNFFVSDKRTNACREILAIELPWLIQLFGKITDFKIIRKKSTGLELDYDDTYLILLEHENNNHGTFTVDVVCRSAVKAFRLFGEDILIEWNGTQEGYLEYNFDTKKMESFDFGRTVIKDSRYADTISENEYLEELRCFFDKIEHPEHSYYDFTDDLETLQIIDRMEA